MIDYQRFWDDLPDFIKYNPGAKHRRRIVMNMLRRISFQTVLDVGCGSGELLNFIFREFDGKKLQLTGCDLSEPQLKINQQKYPSMKFVALDLQKSHLDNKFDLVVCSEVIEHIPDQDSSLKNLATMVKAGGHLLITVPSGKIHATEVHFGHLKHLTTQELNSKMKALGFDAIKTFNWGWPFYKALKYATNANSEWSLKNFTGAYGRFQKITSNVLYYANYFNSRNSDNGVQIFALYRRGNTND